MPKSWEDNWEKVEKLSYGGQGDTIKVRNRKDGVIAVAKVLKRQTHGLARARMVVEVDSLRILNARGARVPKLLEDSTEYVNEPSVEMYLVMEFIPGSTLRKRIETGKPMEVDRAAWVAKSLCETISIGHEEGITHRDLKPDNIMFPDDDLGEPVIIDYGLSFRTDSEQLTHAAEKIKNGFIELPETTAIGGNRRDPRSDLTALCGLFYYCLTGRNVGVLLDELERLPHRRPGQMLSDSLNKADQRIPAIERMLDKGLQHRLENRFQTASDVRDALNRVVNAMKEGSETDPVSYSAGMIARLLARDRKTQLGTYKKQASAIQELLDNTHGNLMSQLKGIRQQDLAGLSLKVPTITFPKNHDLVWEWQKSPVFRLEHHSFTAGLKFYLTASGEECVLHVVHFVGPKLDPVHGSPMNRNSQDTHKEIRIVTLREVCRYSNNPQNVAVLINGAYNDSLTSILQELERDVWSADGSATVNAN